MRRNLMNLLIHNGTIVTMHNRQVIRHGDIVIEDGVIVDIGKSQEVKRKYGRGYEEIDASRMVIIPGLVNTHQHAAMSLLRGYADDLLLKEWLERWIWPIESHMTPHNIYVGALLTAAESIMGGVTTVNTMYHYTPIDNEARAFMDVGLRGVVGHVCFSRRKEEDRRILSDLARSWHNKAEGLIRVSVDPHSPYTVDPMYLKELKTIRDSLSAKFGSASAPIIWHIHVAETIDEADRIRQAFNIQVNNGVMSYLDSLGVLDTYVLASHCVALTDKDVDIMKQREVKVSHNPISNLKLASGVSPAPKLLAKGVTVSLGTDSSCSNNSADMFGVMKTTAVLHKGINKDPTLLPAEKVLEMGTANGAKALSWQNEIGSIEIGKKADIAIVNFDKPHLCPMHSETSHLIYTANAADVETVIVNGRIVMENRRLVTLDVEEVMVKAEKAKTDLLERLRASVK